MPKIKAQVPIQYTSQDGVGPEGENLSAHNRGSQLSGYVGGSNTSIYRQPNIGFGSRSDFTTENVKDKGDYKYDYDKMGSLKYSLQMYKEKGT